MAYLFRLDSRPECLGVFHSHSLHLYDVNTPGDLILRESKAFGAVTSICRVEEDDYVVGNGEGELWYVQILPYSLQVTRMGRVCAVQSLVHLGGSLFFVGSLANDSVIIEVTCNSHSGQVKQLDTIPSLAPI